LDELNALGNLKIKDDHAIFSVNPKFYSLDTVYAASYILMDRAYIFLDGDPEKEILVEIRQKENEDLRRLVYDFNNELLNYALYARQSEKNRYIREAILQRVILVNDPNLYTNQVNNDVDDPEKISEVWEESDKKIENLEHEDKQKQSGD
jgi:His-Xaa-Ser system protein HxsD